MKLVDGEMANGKRSTELGKGSLHIYFPNETYVKSAINKQYWYFEGKIIQNNSQVILEGTGDIDKDFVVLSHPRKYRHYYKWIQSFDVVYKTSQGVYDVHVY